MNKQQFSAFDAIGGYETVERLVDAFYKRVKINPDLKPIFPDDFTEIARKQKKFLTQFLGGPPLYIEEFGHPMLRAKHLRFPINAKRRDAWLNCMNGAMDEIGLEEPWREIIFRRLTMTAHHMQNIHDENGQEG